MALTFRRNKDVPLTFSELDGNFDDLNGRLVSIENDYVLSVNQKTGEISLNTDDIPEGFTNRYWTQARFDNAFAIKTTTNLNEGANLYYTSARVLSLLGSNSINVIQDVDTATVAPAVSQVLTWNGTDWVPADAPGAAGGEANAGQNSGVGLGLYKQKVGTDLQFRTLKSVGGAIQLQNSVTGDEIEFSFSPTATVNFNTQKISNLGTPTAAGDASNKSYVDGHMNGKTVTLTGAIEGTGTFDANSNVSLATTASSLVIPLGTNTSGSYVDSIAAGNGITVSGGTGEAAIVTIALDATDSVSFANLTITGNLTVNGSTATLSTTNTSVEDTLIELGSGFTGTPANDAGFVIERGTQSNVFMGWDESADRVVVATTTATGASTGNLTLTPAAFEAGIVYVDDLILSGTTVTTTTGDLILAASGNISANSNKIISLATPTSATDAATKGYVDTTISTSLSNYSTNLSLAADAGFSTLPIGSNTFTFTGGTNITTDVTGNVVTINVSGTVASATTAASATSATNATNASNVLVDSIDTTNATYYLTFVDDTTGGQYDRLYEDNGLTYNPSTNTLSTGIFSGTASQAQYADLAENYVPDAQYIPGTVLEVGGDAEVTAWVDSEFVAGVVSTNPAYLMNSSCQGVAVALVGRVPVRVMGSINKGQAVYAIHGGVASAHSQGPLVGIALETNLEQGEKLVECMLKV